MKLRPGGNWIAKIICLVIAVVLWLFIMNDQNPVIEGRYTVPVVTTGLPSSLVASGVPETVTLQLRMQRNTMLALRESELHARVDLSEAESGEYPGQTIHLSLPPGVELVEQNPAEFTLRIDNFVLRTVPVSVHIVGKPVEGHEAAVDESVPDTVTVSGASRALDRITAVTATVSVDGQQQSFQTVAPTEARDQDGNIVTEVNVAPANILVKIKMTAIDGRAELPLVAPVTGTPAAGYRLGEVTVTPARITIQAPPGVSEQRTDWQLRPISVEGADKDMVMQVPIPVPAGGTVSPKVAEIHVRIIPQA